MQRCRHQLDQRQSDVEEVVIVAGDFNITREQSQTIAALLGAPPETRWSAAGPQIEALYRGARGSLEQMMTNLKAAGTKEFTLLVKGDVQGSVEAIVAALDKMGTDEVRARIIHAGVGGIDSDRCAV